MSLSLMAVRRGLIVCVVIWLLGSIWLGSDSGISVFGLLAIIGGAVVVLVAWLVAVVTGMTQKQRLKFLWAEPLIVIVVLIGIFSGALFYVRFVASRPFLDRYVARMIATGASHQKHTYVGLFVARETEVLPNGVVRIVTTACMFDECGIAFSPTKPPVIGEDQYKHMTGGWWRWWRSW